MRHASLAVAYAFPALPFAMLATPSISIIPPAYVQSHAATLTQVGGAIMAIRAADAFMDLIAGVALHRLGRRFADVAIPLSCLIAGVAFYEWTHIHAGRGFIWFLLWGLTLVGAWSLFEVAHRVWLVTLIASARKRALLAAWRTGMNRAGTILCLILLGATSRNGVTLANLSLLSTVSMALLAIAAILYCAQCKWLPARDTGDPGEPPSFAGLSGMADMPAVVALMGMTVASNFASGMSAASFYLYMAGLGGMEHLIPSVLLIAALSSIPAASLMPKALRCFGDTSMLVLSQLLIAIILAAFAMLPPLGYRAPTIYIGFAMSAVAAVGIEVSLIAAIARLSEMPPGARGMLATPLFSFSGFFAQAASGAGAAAGIFICSFTGFSPLMPWHSVLVAFAVLPALFRIMAALLALRIGARAGRGLMSPIGSS